MRVPPRILKSIKKSIYNSFGPVHVYLFGSRVDDTKLGGDIDLAIDTTISNKDFKKNKIKFLSNMLRLGFDIKIDLVKYTQDDTLLYHEIQKKHVKLV